MFQNFISKNKRHQCKQLVVLTLYPQLPFLPQCQRPSFTPIRNNSQNYSSLYRRTQLPFFIQIQLHVSAVYDIHQVISAVFEGNVKYNTSFFFHSCGLTQVQNNYFKIKFCKIIFKKLVVNQLAVVKLFVCFWRDSPQWAMASSFTRFVDHTQRRTTVGRTPLDE